MSSELGSRQAVQFDLIEKSPKVDTNASENFVFQ